MRTSSASTTTPARIRGIGYQTAKDVPINDTGWEISPAGFRRVLRDYHKRFGLPIYVTENGTADRADAFRARYIYDHLRAAVGTGLPIERYYHWCFIDNWEWAEGADRTLRAGRVGLRYPATHHPGLLVSSTPT